MKNIVFIFSIAILGITTDAFAVDVERDGDTVSVYGTSANDHIVVEDDYDGNVTISKVTDCYEVLAAYPADEINLVIVYGGDGCDLIENRGASACFIAYGEDGNDCIYGSESTLHWEGLDGGAGADFLYGGKGAETMNGGDGNDYLMAGSWSGMDVEGSVMTGGAGMDDIIGTCFDDLIDAEDGEQDFIQTNGGNDFDNEYAGFDDIDVICD